jgi:hypothetical protein
MAKLPALVTALAEVDGRERKTVEHIARTIRERGYITTGKRGGGANEKTPHEAANLLIALNGADTPKEGPIAIDRFRSLRQYFRGTSKDIRERLAGYDNFPKPIRDVMDVHTFGEALDALIEGVPELVAALRSRAHDVRNDIDPDVLDEHLFGMLRLGLFGLDITFQRYAAKIELYTMYGSERRIDFEANFQQDIDRLESGFYGKEWPDRRISVTIGTPTLIAAWQVLHPGDTLPGIPDCAPAADAEQDVDV